MEEETLVFRYTVTVKGDTLRIKQEIPPQRDAETTLIAALYRRSCRRVERALVIANGCPEVIIAS